MAQVDDPALIPAYAVDGSEIPAEMLRTILWINSAGAAGIATPSSFRVTALSTPGGAVNIAPGGALLPTTYRNASKTETYAVATNQTVQLAIPATTSTGGKSYSVIARVLDWNLNQGQEPDNPETARNWKFDVVVTSTLGTITDPYLVLATIAMPVSTATVTQALITDARNMARPREQTVIRPIPAVASDTQMQLTSAAATGEIFPGGGYDTIGPQVVAIPEWASKVQIQCTWLGVYYPNTNPFGRYWVEWGPSTGSNQREISTDTFRFDAPQAGASRAIWIAASEQTIPVAYRGTSQTFVPKARYDSDASHRGVTMDYMSGMIWQIRFLEVADDSNS